MTLEEFQKRVAGGRIFTVEFVKRKTGETRTMTCRCGVTKHETKGDGPDPLAHAARHFLLPVFEMGKGYRQVPLDGITALRLEGRSFTWDGDAFAFKEAA